jgi:hypothetical protein
MIAMDGNFQQRHYAYASKDEPREEQYPQSFLPPSKISFDEDALSTSNHMAVGINVSKLSTMQYCNLPCQTCQYSVLFVC